MNAESLILQFAESGDRAAAAQIVDHYQRIVYEFCHRILRNESDAGDAAQETFIKVFRRAGRFRGESSLKTWILRIAYNQSIDMLRSRRRRQNVERPIQGTEFRYNSLDAEKLTKIDAVERAVAGLPDLYRVAVLLHYGQGLSYGEMSQILQCAPGTVGSRLAAARERMKELLTTAGFASLVPQWDILLKTSPAPAPPAVLADKLHQIAATTAPASASAALFAAVAALAAVVVTTVIVISPKPQAAPSQEIGIVANVQNPPAPPRVPESAPARERVENPAAAEANRNITKNPAPVAAEKFIFKISGFVGNSSDGAPLEGIPVWTSQIWPPSEEKIQKGASPRRFTTGADGGFSLEVNCGGPTILALHAGEQFSAAAAVAEVIYEVSAPREEKVNLLMEPCAPADITKLNDRSRRDLISYLQKAFDRDRKCYISGTIQREDGRPIPYNLHIRTIDSDGDVFYAGEYVHYETGRFLIGPLDTQKLQLEVLGGAEGYACARDIDTPAGAGRGGIVLTMRSGDAKIKGRVVDGDGRPLANVTLTAVPEAIEDAGMWITPTAECKSGADGNFELTKTGAAGELLRISASHSEKMLQKSRNVLAGSDNVVIMMKAKPVVRGRIVFKNNNHRRPRVRVEMDPQPLRYKGSFQTMVTYSDIDKKSGEFKYTVERGGAATLLIDWSLGDTLLKKRIEVGEEGVDVGTIEID